MRAKFLLVVGMLGPHVAPAFEVPQSPITSPNYDFRQFMENNNAVMEQDRAETVRRIREKDEQPTYDEMVRINGLLRGKPVKKRR